MPKPPHSQPTTPDANFQTSLSHDTIALNHPQLFKASQFWFVMLSRPTSVSCRRKSAETPLTGSWESDSWWRGRGGVIWDPWSTLFKPPLPPSSSSFSFPFFFMFSQNEAGGPGAHECQSCEAVTPAWRLTCGDPLLLQGGIKFLISPRDLVLTLFFIELWVLYLVSKKKFLLMFCTRDDV